MREPKFRTQHLGPSADILAAMSTSERNLALSLVVIAFVHTGLAAMFFVQWRRTMPIRGHCIPLVLLFVVCAVRRAQSIYRLCLLNTVLGFTELCNTGISPQVSRRRWAHILSCSHGFLYAPVSFRSQTSSYLCCSVHMHGIDSSRTSWTV